MRLAPSLAAVALSSVLFVPAVAHAGCETAASITESLWKKYGAIATTAAAATGPAGSTAATVANTVDQMIRFWNEQAGNSWAKVGPRRLEFEKVNSGTVQSAGDRAFISAYPASGPLTVEFRKTDGNGKAKVTVCTVDAKNHHEAVKSFEIDADDKDGKTWKVEVPNAKDHLLVVVVDGRAVTKKVEYAFTAK